MLSFGAFRFDPDTGELWRLSWRVKLQPDEAIVLRVLVLARGHAVWNSEFLEHLNRNKNEDVGPGRVRQLISQLRKHLHDSPEHPTFIETVPSTKRHVEGGYRFVAAVTEEASRPGVPTEEPRATPREPFPQVARGRRVHLASRAVIAIALVLLAIVAWLVGRKGTSPSAEAAPPPPAFCAPPVAIQILSRNISDQSPAAKLAGALRKAGCSVELNRPDDSAAAVPDSKVVFFHDADKGKANALCDYVRAQVTLLVEDRMKWAQGRKIPDGHLDIWMKG